MGYLLGGTMNSATSDIQGGRIDGYYFTIRKKRLENLKSLSIAMFNLFGHSFLPI